MIRISILLYLALFVTEKVIAQDGGKFNLGWITSKAGDGGIDFVGKIGIGKNFHPLTSLF